MVIDHLAVSCTDCRYDESVVKVEFKTHMTVIINGMYTYVHSANDRKMRKMRRDGGGLHWLAKWKRSFRAANCI